MKEESTLGEAIRKMHGAGKPLSLEQTIKYVQTQFGAGRCVS